MVKGFPGRQAKHVAVAFDKPEQKVNVPPQLQLISQLKQSLKKIKNTIQDKFCKLTNVRYLYSMYTYHYKFCETILDCVSIETGQIG